MDTAPTMPETMGMITARPSTTPRTLQHEGQPDWGTGLVVQDLPRHWVIFFEHAGEKKFVKELATCLLPITLDPVAMAALQTKALNRPGQAGAAKKARTGPRAAGAKAVFATTGEQIAFFETLFPGGFAGKVFIKDERGLAGATGKEGHKEAAIVLAQQLLSPERFESDDTETLFESAKKVLQATTMVFPMEGAIRFSTIDEASRGAALEGLKNLLHGEGDYAARLESFVGAINMTDKAGAAKAATWPFATIFGALFNPNEFVCVKPTAFKRQASTVGIPAATTSAVSAIGYRHFLEVATKTGELLRAAGHEPRDLVDVYTFIWRTHHEKPK